MRPDFRSELRVADRVRVADKRDHWHSQLECGKEAIVSGAYDAGYELMFPDGRTVSWFHGKDLTLIERNAWDELREWDGAYRRERDAYDRALRGDVR